MIADEIDVPGPAKVVSRRQAQDWTFGILFVLLIPETMILGAIKWWWQVRPPTILIWLASGLNFILARFAVGAWLRSSGRTVEGMPTVEIWTRGPATPPAGATGEAVEVRVPFGVCLGFGLFQWATAAIVGSLLLHRPEPGRMDDLDWTGLLLIACLIPGGTWTIAFGLLAKPTRADDDGIWAYPIGLSVRRRFVPWSAIGAVEIRRHADAGDRAVAAGPTLLGHRGERLIWVNLSVAPPDERQRLVDFVLVRFPRLAKVAPGDFT